MTLAIYSNSWKQTCQSPRSFAPHDSAPRGGCPVPASAPAPDPTPTTGPVEGMDELVFIYVSGYFERLATNSCRPFLNFLTSAIIKGVS